jgi:hypothetical protein
MLLTVATWTRTNVHCDAVRSRSILASPHANVVTRPTEDNLPQRAVVLS